jgi:hypothetical protein
MVGIFFLYGHSFPQQLNAANRLKTGLHNPDISFPEDDLLL